MLIIISKDYVALLFASRSARFGEIVLHWIDSKILFLVVKKLKKLVDKVASGSLVDWLLIYQNTKYRPALVTTRMSIT